MYRPLACRLKPFRRDRLSPRVAVRSRHAGRAAWRAPPHASSPRLRRATTVAYLWLWRSGDVAGPRSKTIVGKRLVQCFTEAERLGGLVGKMRLASMAQVTSTEAG